MMAANYRHIGCLENRLGRHYSRFSASGPAAPLAAQSLARRKSPNHGSNRRSQARSQGDKETKPTPEPRGGSLVSAIDLSGHPRKLPIRRSTTRGVGGKRGGKLANGPAYFLTVDFFGGAVFFREAPFGVDGLRTSLTALPAWNRTALLAAIWMASPVCGS